MSSKYTETINNLQKNAENIRNICILAHVDHGKTTLADSLLATCGIIGKNNVGKIRYMDSRPDEQQRGITMKSSAVSLKHTHENIDHLINVIDSPGHVDFSGEVSTGIRLCDGCVILVDVVEGVCPQTQTVLRQAWLEKLKPILVLNKMDRLITELKQSPLEAYNHLQNLLEQVNAVTASLFSVDTMKKEDEIYSKTKENDTSSGTQAEDEDEKEDLWDDSKLYFSPNQGNVVFASATDAWGFTTHHFAEFCYEKLAEKLKVKKNGMRMLLRKKLWGDYYFDPKQKNCYGKNAYNKGKEPMFVKFILKNLWAIYEAVMVNNNKELSSKIAASLNAKIDRRVERNFKSEPKRYLTAICSHWLPLASSLLSSVCEIVPSPKKVSEERVEKLMSGTTRKFTSLPKKTQILKKHYTDCNVDSDVTIALVSKMISLDKSCLPKQDNKMVKLKLQEESDAKRRALIEKYKENQKKLQSGEGVECPKETAKEETQNEPADNEKGENLVEESDSKIIAFTRVFSGKIKVGDRLFVLGPKYDPSKVDFTKSEEEIVSSSDHVTIATVDSLFNWLGSSVTTCEPYAQAGCIVGIGGMESAIINSATLSSTLHCPPFNALFVNTNPILRVAIEPKKQTEQHILSEGMRKLNQADPCVEIFKKNSGFVIATSGEVHLRRCLEDLELRFAKIKFSVSKPEVPFRETIIHPPKYDVMNELIGGQEKDLMKKFKNMQIEKDGRNKEEGKDDVGHEKEQTKKNKVVTVCTADGKVEVKIEAVPLPEEVINLLIDNRQLVKEIVERSKKKKDSSEIDDEMKEKVSSFKNKLVSRFNESRRNRKLWSSGDIVDQIWSFGPQEDGPNLLVNKIPAYEKVRPSIWSLFGDEEGNKTRSLRNNDQSVVTGFQIATGSGPMCGEPLHGVCFVVHEWKTTESQPDIDMESDWGGHQLISVVKDGLYRSFKLRNQRLMKGMFVCTVQANGDVLGNVYAVLKSREADVTKEEMKGGTNLFLITAEMPMYNSFGFIDAIRTKTSGLAFAHLQFSHWQTIPFDPEWEPTTEEEISHFGAKADFENPAMKHMKEVLKRKGRLIEKTVEDGTKQRTIGRNK